MALNNMSTMKLFELCLAIMLLNADSMLMPISVVHGLCLSLLYLSNLCRMIDGTTSYAGLVFTFIEFPIFYHNFSI